MTDLAQGGSEVFQSGRYFKCIFSFLRGMVTKHLMDRKVENFKTGGKMGKLANKVGTEVRVGTLSETDPELGWISCKEPKT